MAAPANVRRFASLVKAAGLIAGPEGFVNEGPVSQTGIMDSTVVDTAATHSTIFNQWRSKVTLTPATVTTATAGFNCIRGEIGLTSGKTLQGTSFVTGVYGRANIFGTVAIGSGALAAVYAKMDLNGSTLTSGHIAPLQSNIVNPPSDSSKLDLVYVESASGNVINSYLKAFGKSSYVFDLEANVHTQMSTTGTAGATATKGWLKILVNGVVRYIPLTDSVS